MIWRIVKELVLWCCVVAGIVGGIGIVVLTGRRPGLCMALLVVYEVCLIVTAAHICRHCQQRITYDHV